ncbi:hypothetical protein T484DRAFT_1875917 [Baffinella frigidus]|nr:hypothetical protein T484DRAFT_1875917 [Cryptophyta sp. CCMP2293]
MQTANFEPPRSRETIPLVMGEEMVVEMELAGVQHSPRAVPDDLDLSSILQTANALVADVMAALDLPTLLDPEPVIAIGPPASPEEEAAVETGDAEDDGDLSGSDDGRSDDGGAYEAPMFTRMPSLPMMYYSPRTREAVKMVAIVEEEVAWEEVAKVFRGIMSKEVGRCEEELAGSRARLVELEAAVAAEKAQGAEPREDSSDDERGDTGGDLEELLEDLERMVAANVMEVRLARMALAAAREQKRLAWVHPLADERAAAELLQTTVRGHLHSRKFATQCVSARRVAAALLPALRRRIARTRYLARFDVATLRIQSVIWGHCADTFDDTTYPYRVLQNGDELFLARFDVATLRIQSVVRGHWARAEFHELDAQVMSLKW